LNQLIVFQDGNADVFIFYIDKNTFFHYGTIRLSEGRMPKLARSPRRHWPGRLLLVI
jgi:hypothetical protein